VTGPDGPVGNLGLRLAATYSDEMVAETNFDAATTMTDATGAFTFLGVPSGAYSLRAIKVPPAVPAPASPVMNVIQTGSGTTSFAASPSGDQPASSSIPPGPTYWADVPVTVGDRDVSNLEVVLRDGFHITGRVEFDGTSDKPSASVIGHLLVTIDPIDGHSGGVPSPLQGEVGANQEIATYAVPPGKYFIRLSAFAADWLAMPGWSFRSATLDGHDVSDTPLAIDRDISGVVLTMTDHPSELSGTVRDSNGRGDMTPNVAVFPADPRSWVDYGSPLSIRRLRMVHVGRDGTYKFTSLPKGDYGLVAIPDEQSGEWQDLKMLEALAKVATKVTIVDGEKKTQDLRVSQVK
jgi:hypothetical protein